MSDELGTLIADAVLAAYKRGALDGRVGFMAQLMKAAAPPEWPEDADQPEDSEAAR